MWLLLQLPSPIPSPLASCCHWAAVQTGCADACLTILYSSSASARCVGTCCRYRSRQDWRCCLSRGTTWIEHDMTVYPFQRRAMICPPCAACVRYLLQIPTVNPGEACSMQSLQDAGGVHAALDLRRYQASLELTFYIKRWMFL
jgi:hypothetical protein